MSERISDRRQHPRTGSWAARLLSAGTVAAVLCATLGGCAAPRPDATHPAFIIDDHKGWVEGIAFSPDGDRVAITGRYTPQTEVWDVGSRKRVMTLQGAGGTSACYSPDGKRLLVGIRLFNAETGELIRTFDSHITYAVAALSPDGRRVAFCGPCQRSKVYERTDPRTDPGGKHSQKVVGTVAEGVVQVFAATGEELFRFDTKEAHPNSLSFSTDGNRLAVGTHGPGAGILMWDLKMGEKVFSAPRRSYSQHVAFSPDGRWLAVSDNQRADGLVPDEVCLCDPRTGEEVYRLKEFKKRWRNEVLPVLPSQVS